MGIRLTEKHKHSSVFAAAWSGGGGAGQLKILLFFVTVCIHCVFNHGQINRFSGIKVVNTTFS